MKVQLLADTMFTNQDWVRLGNCIQLLASSSIGGMTEEVTYFLLSVGGLLGVNLSEQGNAGLKQSATMHLVKAAKYDVATMLLQEIELFKFNQNLGTSSGKGPSPAVRDAKDGKKQLQEAEDFVNILDDEEAILLEAQQANNPMTFITKAVEKHGAKEDGPKCKRITSLANETKDQKGPRKKKRVKKSMEGPDEGKIKEKIFLACEVLKMRYEEVIKLKSEDGKRQKGRKIHQQ